MRPLSAKTKRILTRADLWARECVLCGKFGGTAEHALMFAGRQMDRPQTILPCCPECNAGGIGATKKQARLAAVLVWKIVEVGEGAVFLPAEIPSAYKRLWYNESGDLSAAVAGRAREWARTLARAL